MKKIASLLLTTVMLATMFTVFAVPASAEDTKGYNITTDTTTDKGTTKKLTLEEDVEISDFSNCNGNHNTFELNLNGHTLTVKGTLKVQANRVCISGNGGTIRCEGNGTVSFRADNLDNDNSSYWYINNKSIDISDVSFLDCKGTDPIFYIGKNRILYEYIDVFGVPTKSYYNDVHVYFSKVRFENCHNAADGCCIYINRSKSIIANNSENPNKFDFMNCEFVNCGDASKDGGCIYINDLIKDKDIISFENCRAYECKAHRGGFMFINDKVTKINEELTDSTGFIGTKTVIVDSKEVAQNVAGWNVVSNCTAEYGGGIYAADMTYLKNFIFVDNHATKDGGGMYNYTKSGAASIIENCRFYHNTAGTETDKRWGGGLYVDDSDGWVQNCAFFENTAYNTGAELYTNTNIKDCVVVSNFKNNAVKYDSQKSSCTVSSPSDYKFDTKNGNGTKDSPYLISDTADWDALLCMTKAGKISENTYINLQNDILIVNPIGLWTGDSKTEYPFKGIFNGQGHTVTLFLPNNASNNATFNFTKGATVTNLAVKGYIKGNSGAGGIVSHAEDTTVEYCQNYAEINGTDYAGGIAGWAKDTKITDCTNYGEIIADGKDVGGILGCCGKGSVTILNCINYGTVKGGTNAGGFAGMVNSGATLNLFNSINDSKVTGKEKVDAVIGSVSGNTCTENCFANKDLCDNITGATALSDKVMHGVSADANGNIMPYAFNNNMKKQEHYDSSWRLLILNPNDNTIRFCSKENTITKDNIITKLGEEKTTSVYYVSGKVDINDRMEINGTVFLVLEDGCELNAQNGIRLTKGNMLLIYAESENLNTAGILRANTNGGDAAIGGSQGRDTNAKNVYNGDTCGDFVLTGGKVYVTSTSGVGIGGGKGGSALRGLFPGNGGDGGNITVTGGYMEIVVKDNVNKAYGGGKGGDSIEQGAGKFSTNDGKIILGENMKMTYDPDNNKGKLIIELKPSVLGSVLSGGNLWIVIAVAVLAIGTVAALIIVKKKKKPALAGGAENTDKE